MKFIISLKHRGGNMSLQIGRYIRSARKHKGMKVFELANRV